MSVDRETRLARLGSRFSRDDKPAPAPAEKPSRPPRQRARQSIYASTELMARVEQAYRKLAHTLYPRQLSKSDFLEALLEHGLSDLDAVRASLSDVSEQSE